jgi:P2-related tail formation protein
MQLRLDAQAPGAVVLLGINGPALEATNAEMTAGRALPWLQDVAAVDAWTQWAVEYRDVVIVDGAGVKRGAFNLTLHDLALAENQAALEALLLGAR